MLTGLSNIRVADAQQNENKEIILKDTGSRKASIDNESAEGSYKIIPTDYQQISYHELNGYFWLSTCILIIS